MVNCNKTLENVEYLQAHVLNKHNRFTNLELLDDLVKNGEIKFSEIKPIPDKPKKLYKIKEYCLQGHKFTPENTVIAKQGRLCKICSVARAKRYKVKRLKRWDKEALDLPSL
jgi:hypothetical protein